MITERIREVADERLSVDIRMVVIFLCDEVDRLSQRIDDLEKRERSAP